MKKVDILELVKPYSSVSIIGMQKNVGKTTVLNHMMEAAREKLTLGLTSIGRDGEEEDRVTATTKPRIYVERGTLIATSKECLFNSDITKEILRTTGIPTAMGEVVVARALSDGYVELGGPSLNTYMKLICEELRALNCDMVLVDGALSRKSFASPAVTEATILSTGAALGRNMDKVIGKTVHAYNLLSTPVEEDEEVLDLAGELPEEARISIINKDKTVEALELVTSLEGARAVADNLTEHTSHVMIKGIVSDKLLEEIMKATDLFKRVVFLAEDGTKLFLSEDTIYKFKRMGGELRVINPINVVCITCNPESPFGYKFSSEEFVNRLQEKVQVPVLDIVRRGGC